MSADEKGENVSEAVRTHEVMKPHTWITVRHSLAIALANYAISQREYDNAMTEVMGTSDKSRW